MAAGILLAAALLTRMDAAPQVVTILAFLAISRRIDRRQLLLIAAIVGITFVGILLFQQVYFGDALPNTYYQKVVGSSAVERIRNGMLMFGEYAARDVLMMALVSAGGLYLYRTLRSRAAALLAALFLVQCMYSVWVGGDYAEPELASANRFITQGVPALTILFSLVSDRILEDALGRSRNRPPASILASVAALVTLMVISGVPWFHWASDNAPLLRADIRRVRAGLAIAANTAPEATIAVHAAGQIPYYSERRTIDLLGLNDPVIAHGPRSTSFYPGHDKWDYDYSIAQLRPDLIADNWIRLADFIKARPDYHQLDNGMYVRVDTALVDEAGLQKAYP